MSTVQEGHSLHSQVSFISGGRLFYPLPEDESWCDDKGRTKNPTHKYRPEQAPIGLPFLQPQYGYFPRQYHKAAAGSLNELH